MLETAFLCLATVSTVGLLTTVINNTPVVPEDEEEDLGLMLSDNSQCIMFALFMIWFASITVNLGTTFLSGGLAANADDILLEPSCPIILGPYRHYALNFLWILTIVFCLSLTLYHLHKLKRWEPLNSLIIIRYKERIRLRNIITLKVVIKCQLV